MSNTSLLQVEGLKKTYGKREVVKQVSLSVQPNQIVGLLGPNGAGKTTSFYMIAGLTLPKSGKITFKDKDITRLPMNKRAKEGLGYLPQEESIFRRLSVEDNLLAIIQTQKEKSRKDQLKQVNELLEKFQISHLRKSMAITLSGGEKRRLSVARCLCTKPSLLMLDEPFSGVDPLAVEEIQTIIKQLKEEGVSVLITDHNVRETLNIVDYAYLISDGEIIFDGNATDFKNSPIAKSQYLGETFSN